MNGLFIAIAALVVFLIYRTVSAAVKDDKKEAERIMETANNQRPTPSTVTSGSETMGVPSPEPTENESSRSAYDILLATLAEQGCRIKTDELCEEIDKNCHILSFMYQGGDFISRASTETQFFLLRFLTSTECKDGLLLLHIVNSINDQETLYKAIVCQKEDQSYVLEFDYCCMSVTSQDIIAAMNDILFLALRVHDVQRSLHQMESTRNQ